MADVFGFATLADMQRVDRAVKSIERTQPQPRRQRKSPPVLPAGHFIYAGKTSGAINKGASGTVNVWTGTSSTGLAVSSPLVQFTSVYNRFANVGDAKWVFVIRFSWGDELFAAEC